MVYTKPVSKFSGHFFLDLKRDEWRLKCQRSCSLCWNHVPKTRQIKPAASLVITLREAGGTALLWERPDCAPVSMWYPCGSHPRWHGSGVCWGGLRATLLSPHPLSLLTHFQLPCLHLVHMPPQGTQNSISHSLLESPIPWPWGMASCQCSLSSVLCPLSVASESGGWRGELEDSWMQASLLGSGEFLTRKDCSRHTMKGC